MGVTVNVQGDYQTVTIQMVFARTDINIVVSNFDKQIVDNHSNIYTQWVLVT